MFSATSCALRPTESSVERPTNKPVTSLTALLSDKRLRTASGKLSEGQTQHVATNPQEVKLCSGIKVLDDFFSGGLTFGTLLEMGIPFGNGGRRLLAQFIAAATSGLSGGPRLWCLWISARPQPEVYPPAWQALGADLNHLRFASSASPVADLRAAFLDDLFRVIVIDHPAPLKPDEHVFLAQCARQHHKIIIVARDSALTPKDSNTAARYRMNIRRPPRDNLLEITPIRGLHQSARLSSFFQHPNFSIAP
jgi:hypothetical protein